MRSNTGSKRKSRTTKDAVVLKVTLMYSRNGSRVEAYKSWSESLNSTSGLSGALYQIQQSIDAWLSSDELGISLIKGGAGSKSRSRRRSNSCPRILPAIDISLVKNLPSYSEASRTGQLEGLLSWLRSLGYAVANLRSSGRSTSKATSST
jgi:hypothetical protein